MWLLPLFFCFRIQISELVFIFQSKLAKADVVMNFRPNYFGETSRFTLEAMRHGAVVVVRDIGWYHELPNTAALRIKDQNGIVSEVAGLVSDRELPKINPPLS